MGGSRGCFQGLFPGTTGNLARSHPVMSAKGLEVCPLIFRHGRSPRPKVHARTLGALVLWAICWRCGSRRLHHAVHSRTAQQHSSTARGDLYDGNRQPSPLPSVLLRLLALALGLGLGWSRVRDCLPRGNTLLLPLTAPRSPRDWCSRP